MLDVIHIIIDQSFVFIPLTMAIRPTFSFDWLAIIHLVRVSSYEWCILLRTKWWRHVIGRRSISRRSILRRYGNGKILSSLVLIASSIVAVAIGVWWVWSAQANTHTNRSWQRWCIHIRRAAGASIARTSKHCNNASAPIGSCMIWLSIIGTRSWFRVRCYTWWGSVCATKISNKPKR